MWIFFFFFLGKNQGGWSIEYRVLRDLPQLSRLTPTQVKERTACARREDMDQTLKRGV